MQNKLLAVKQGKNVSLYSVTYDFYSLNEYIKQLDEKYSYTDVKTIETTLLDGIVLSMQEYDSKKDECHIKNGYKLIRDIEIINEHEKRSVIEIEIEYFSVIAKTLKETFLDNGPLLNTTALISLMRKIYDLNNTFSYNPLLDDKNLSWDDPRRALDARFNVSRINKFLNSRQIKLNKYENKNTFDIISSIVESLQSYITIEQVGLFPIEDNMPDFNELLTAFAVRNEDCELFFGSLENVNINFSGFELINMKRNEILNAYSFNEDAKGIQKQKNRIDVFNRFLQF